MIASDGERRGVAGSDPAAADEMIDPLTVAAIAVIAYFVATLAHEGLGHAGITALLGGRVDQITSASCSCDTSGLTPWAARAVFAGGCGANVLTGALAIWGDRFMRRADLAARYSAWLFGHVSLFIAFGYLMVFPFLPAGDWHDFVAGLSAPLVWKLALTVVGVVGYVVTMTHARRMLDPILGLVARRRRARTLTLVPYLVGGTIETLSSVVGGGGILTIISAAPATFGGTIGLLFVGGRATTPRATMRSPAPTLRRSAMIIVAGFLVALVHLFWFGPGLLHRG